MPEDAPPTKIDLQYAEDLVVFRVANCSDHKKFGFCSIDRDDGVILMKKLKYLERLTWSQWSALDRRGSGLTCELYNSESFNMIAAEDTSGKQLIERRYFHFRVEQRGDFRIFGYQAGKYFFITHFDPHHEIHS